MRMLAPVALAAALVMCPADVGAQQKRLCSDSRIDRGTAVTLTILSDRVQMENPAAARAYVEFRRAIQGQFAADTSLRSRVTIQEVETADEDDCNPRQLLNAQLRGMPIGRAAAVAVMSFTGSDDVRVSSTLYFSRRHRREDLEARGRDLASVPHDLELEVDGRTLLGRLSADYVTFPVRSVARADLETQMGDLAETQFVSALASYLAILQSTEVDQEQLGLVRLVENGTLALSDEMTYAPMTRAVAQEMLGVARIRTAGDAESAMSAALEAIPDDLAARNLLVLAQLARRSMDWSAVGLELGRLRAADPFDQILAINRLRAIEVAQSSAPSEPLAVEASKIVSQLTQIDTRGHAKVSPYVGAWTEALAVLDANLYRDPDTFSTKAHGLFGVAFEQRVAGDQARRTNPRNSQIWIGSSFQMATRSAELFCFRPTPAVACSSPQPFPGRPLMVSTATSLEATFSIRWEILGLRPPSGFGSNLYLSSSFGFIAVRDSGPAAANHSFNVGLVLTNGTMVGSYFEAGLGKNELFVSQNLRFRTEGFVTLGRIPKLGRFPWALRPFLRISGDFDPGGGSDKVQVLGGISISLIELTSII